MTSATRMGRPAIVLLLLTAVMFGPRLTDQARAHDAYTHVARWPTTDIPFGDVSFQAAPSVSNLTSSQESAIYFGAVPWNNLNTSLTMVRISDLNVELDHKDCGSGANSLHWQTIDGKANATTGSGAILAQTWMCSVAPWPGLGDPVYRMTHAAIVYDRDESWYFGTGTPGSTQFDMRGVSTHEFGHFGGWRLHLSGVCSNPQHTMCPTVSAGTPSFDQRTLETHDGHTFTAAYP